MAWECEPAKAGECIGIIDENGERVAYAFDRRKAKAICDLVAAAEKLRDWLTTPHNYAAADQIPTSIYVPFVSAVAKVLND